MTESESFSSLLALVDSHLSKSNVPDTRVRDIDEKINRAVQIPSMNGVQAGLSDGLFVSPSRLQLPDLGISSSEINDVLAGQISNMLIAKEKKKQEEKFKLEEEMRKLKLQEEEKDDLIDLMKALQMPCEKPPPKQESLSSSSSLASLLEENTRDFECGSLKPKKPSLEETLPEVLPCTTDMSYILYEKIPFAKPSKFALVLTSRYRRVAAPYLREKVPNTVKRFDFSTKSPCDLIKERLRKPTTGNPNYVDIMELLMGTKMN